MPSRAKTQKSKIFLAKRHCWCQSTVLFLCPGIPVAYIHDDGFPILAVIWITRVTSELTNIDGIPVANEEFPSGSVAFQRFDGHFCSFPSSCQGNHQVDGLAKKSLGPTLRFAGQHHLRRG